MLALSESRKQVFALPAFDADIVLHEQPVLLGLQFDFQVVMADWAPDAALKPGEMKIRAAATHKTLPLMLNSRRKGSRRTPSFIDLPAPVSLMDFIDRVFNPCPRHT